jgi:hypothetical protein
MRQVNKPGQRLLDDLARRLPRDIHDEANATGIVLV